MFWRNAWPSKDVKSYFQLKPLMKVLLIANLQHAANRYWACAEPEYRHFWMKLRSRDNHSALKTKEIQRSSDCFKVFRKGKLPGTLIRCDFDFWRKATLNIIGISVTEKMHIEMLILIVLYSKYPVFWNKNIDTIINKNPCRFSFLTKYFDPFLIDLLYVKTLLFSSWDLTVALVSVISCCYACITGLFPLCFMFSLALHVWFFYYLSVEPIFRYYCFIWYFELLICVFWNPR